MIPERLGWKTVDERAETIEAANLWESRAMSAEAKVAEQAATIERLTGALQEIQAMRHHYPDNGLRMRLVADSALSKQEPASVKEG